MTTPPPVRRKRAKTPPNYNRSRSEYHENAPPPLPPRPMYSGTVNASTLPMMATADSDVPPPIPSTPRPNLPRSPIRTLPPTTTDERVYPSEKESFSLSELVKKHSKLLPIKVRVTKGFFGERGEDSVIPVDEMYNLYFVKKAKVVTISDSTKCKYIVPVNSASKFGLIYQSPTLKRSETHVFETVEDIILAVPLPKVVFAQLAHQGNDENTSVHKNEVLVVKGIHKPGRLKTMFRSNQEQLKVFSLKTMKEKNLTKDVFCRFTVDPQYTQLYLPELLRYVDSPIPSSAKLFLDYDSGDPLPDFLVSGVVQLEKVDTEISIIASQFCDIENEDEHQFSSEGANLTERMVDIPVTLDIEVSIIPPHEACDESDYEYHQLYDDAMNLVKAFDPHTLSRFDTSAEYSYVAQTRFFSAVRKGHEKEGLDIVFPSMRLKSPVSDSGSSDYIGPDDDYEECSFPQPNVTESLPSSASSKPEQAHYVNSMIAQRPKSANQPPAPPKSPRRSVADLPPPLPPARSREPNEKSRPNSSLQSPGLNSSPKGVSPPSPRSASQRVYPPRAAAPGDQTQVSLPPHVPSGDLSSQLGDLQRTVSGITGRVDRLEGDSREISALKKDVNELQPLVHNLHTTCGNIQVEVNSLKKEIEELRIEIKRLFIDQSGGYQSEETVSLEQLNQEQVLQLLDSIDLQKYRAIFKAKSIDGITLAQYTEDNLISNLMMSSRRDRIRLLNVINTRWVRLIPDADGGNYVAFEKTS